MNIIANQLTFALFKIATRISQDNCAQI